MKSHRIISHSCAVAAAALVALPACAQAGSALSGYGGPGEGSQAVLGSALIGGHGRGSGGGGSGAGSSTSSSGSSAAGAGETSSTSGSPATQQSSGAGASSAQSGLASASPGRGRGASHASSPERSATPHAAARPAASPHGLYPASERVPAGGQGTVLGLTGEDLFYVILAAVILVLMGFFTRRVGDPAGRARIGG